MSSTHLLALLLLLLGAVDALEDDFQDIMNHIDILKGSVSPPTRTPEEEAEDDRMLKDAVNSLEEPANARKENVDRSNEIAQQMNDLSEKHREHKSRDFLGFRGHWDHATPPPSLFDKSTKRRRANGDMGRNKDSGAMKSTSDDSIANESAGKVISGEKTAPVETRPVEIISGDSVGNTKLETATTAVKNMNVQKDKIPGENTQKQTTEESSEWSLLKEKTTHDDPTPEDTMPGKTTTEQIAVDDSQRNSDDKKVTTEYSKVETASEDTTTTDSARVAEEQDSFQQRSAGNSGRPTVKNTPGKKSVPPFGPRGGDSRKKRSLTKGIHSEMSTKSPEKSSGLKFLEKVEVQEPGKANKTVKYRLAAKPKWFGPGMSGYDSSKKSPGNKVHDLLNMEKLKTTNPKDVKNVGVQGARKTVTIHKRPRSQGRFGPRGGDSRKKRSLTIGIHSKKFAAQGPGLGKLLSDAAGDKRIFF